MPTRYEKLLARRAPQRDRRFFNFSESFESQIGETTKYLIGAMSPVAPQFTTRLIEDGKRIENQLQKRLEPAYPALSFRRQGSVSNNTHIKYHSDVDILVIIDKFEVFEHPQQPAIPYHGNADQDLIDLRSHSAAHLKEAFPTANIDNEGSTCVTISGGTLNGSVDAVPSAWFNTVAWSQTKQEHERGIEVYNREKKARILNRPFLFNHRVHQHDIARLGAPRSLIRLLKNIKADHEKSATDVDIDFSSFDICSLVYRMPDHFFSGFHRQPLQLIRNLLSWMGTVYQDSQLHNSVLVVDDSRLICDTVTKLPSLRLLIQDLSVLYQQAMQETGNRQLLMESHL